MASLNYMMMINKTSIGLGPTYSKYKLMRSEELEKRQLFLRSYQFSRKQTVAERIKKSFFRVKKVIWVRFRSARKLRRVLWLKLKNGLCSFTTRRTSRKSFFRINNKFYC